MKRGWFLYKMARAKTSDDVTFEMRPEVSEGTSHVCI